MYTFLIWTDVFTSSTKQVIWSTYPLYSNAESISANFSSSSIHVQTSATHSFDNNYFLTGEGNTRSLNSHTIITKNKIVETANSLNLCLYLWLHLLINRYNACPCSHYSTMALQCCFYQCSSKCLHMCNLVQPVLLSHKSLPAWASLKLYSAVLIGKSLLFCWKKVNKLVQW